MNYFFYMNIFGNLFIILITLILFIANPSFAGYNYYDSITTEKERELLDSVINSFYLKECCNDTLAKCLKTRPVCSIAYRFYNFASWLILKEKSYNESLIQLDKRYSSFFGTDTFHIDIKNQPHAGNTSSPITIVAYISASCPLCKKVCIPLYFAVTEGSLSGKALLYLKPLLPRIGDMAFMAAVKLDKFWKFFLSLEKEKRRLDEKILISKAKNIGLDIKKFKTLIYDKNLEKELQKAREEAIANGASITPTFYINKHRYRSYKDPQWLIDAVEYEYERFIKIKNKKSKY